MFARVLAAAAARRSRSSRSGDRRGPVDHDDLNGSPVTAALNQAPQGGAALPTPCPTGTLSPSPGRGNGDDRDHRPRHRHQGTGDAGVGTPRKHRQIAQAFTGGGAGNFSFVDIMPNSRAVNLLDLRAPGQVRQPTNGPGGPARRGPDPAPTRESRHTGRTSPGRGTYLP